MKIRLSPLFENWDFPFVTHQNKRSATFCGKQRSDRTCGIRSDRETPLIFNINGIEIIHAPRESG